MPEPIPLGLTCLLAIERAIVGALLVKSPAGGRVETVFTLCDHFFFAGTRDFLASPRLGFIETVTKEDPMIRKLASGQYRLYSRKINPQTGRRRNLGTFRTRAAAEKHERAVQFFKRA